MLNEFVPWGCCAIAVCTSAVFGIKLAKLNKTSYGTGILCNAVSESNDTVYIVLNEDIIPIYVSENVLDLFGLDIDTVKADVNSLEWCVSDEEKKEFRREFDKRIPGEPFIKEFTFTNIETKAVHNGKASIIDNNEGYLIIKIIEITSEIKIREELKNELERVKTEEQHKSDFLSKMSHEIRTPMNGILGMITLAKHNIDNTKEVLTNLSKADALAQVLLSLINDILDMSKIESGKVVLEHEKFDLIDVFNRLNEMFSGTCEQKNINLIMNREDMDIRYVVGDSLRLMQILINFVSNATKYTAKNGNISITFKQMNKLDNNVHMMFEIKDNGKGMDPRFLSRIFKPFEQETASTTRKFGGTGLGMAIADNLVKLMGGHIVVDTALGRGSAFSVYIPLEIAEGEQNMDISLDNDAQNATNDNILNGLRILMAEDNEINAEIAVELLSLEGAETEVAENGLIAIDKFKASKTGYYDVILMDIQMPELDGWSATKKIREINSDYAQKIPIFALSANAFIEDKRHSIEIGMNGHISKPIDFDDLKKQLSIYIKR